MGDGYLNSRCSEDYQQWTESETTLRATRALIVYRVQSIVFWCYSPGTIRI